MLAGQGKRESGVSGGRVNTAHGGSEITGARPPAQSPHMPAFGALPPSPSPHRRRRFSLSPGGGPPRVRSPEGRSRPRFSPTGNPGWAGRAKGAEGAAVAPGSGGSGIIFYQRRRDQLPHPVTRALYKKAQTDLEKLGRPGHGRRGEGREKQPRRLPYRVARARPSPPPARTTSRGAKGRRRFS